MVPWILSDPFSYGGSKPSVVPQCSVGWYIGGSCNSMFWSLLIWLEKMCHVKTRVSLPYLGHGHQSNNDGFMATRIPMHCWTHDSTSYNIHCFDHVTYIQCYSYTMLYVYVYIYAIPYNIPWNAQKHPIPCACSGHQRQGGRRRRTHRGWLTPDLLGWFATTAGHWDWFESN